MKILCVGRQVRILSKRPHSIFNQTHILKPGCYGVITEICWSKHDKDEYNDGVIYLVRSGKKVGCMKKHQIIAV